jgi:nicotinamide-nucleotide amidase
VLPEEEIFQAFVEKKLTLSTAESCTGGLIAAKLVSIPDASKYFLGGIVAYSNEAKKTLLNVRSLDQYGAVSEEVALEMAQGAQKKFQSDVALSTTGIAGPGGGSEKKPVGMVCFCLLFKDVALTETRFFSGDRGDVMHQASYQAFAYLIEFLSQL